MQNWFISFWFSISLSWTLSYSQWPLCSILKYYSDFLFLAIGLHDITKIFLPCYINIINPYLISAINVRFCLKQYLLGECLHICVVVKQHFTHFMFNDWLCYIHLQSIGLNILSRYLRLQFRGCRLIDHHSSLIGCQPSHTACVHCARTEPALAGAMEGGEPCWQGRWRVQLAYHRRRRE